ncbi:hypothetical protein [Bifidobacterium sp. SO1]|nr:hypothetical protein [Bifidobacterium sp. SO1]MBT1162892.1 hypothetical protein [Bifidobacterium sp. SO1]
MAKPGDRELERMREEYRLKTERDERISRLALQCRMRRKTKKDATSADH